MTNSTNNENLIKNADIQRIAEEGAKIYAQKKDLGKRAYVIILKD